MTMPALVRFDSIAGVPVHYAREPVAPYGTIGFPRKPRLTQEFLDKVNRCFDELWFACPYGDANAIVTAGAYVDKAGRHGQGRAIDIDSIWWENKTLITKQYPSNIILYLSVESIIRKHFGTVLGYLYNKAHQDHWHIDDGREPRFYRVLNSPVLFAQAALVNIWGKKIEIDGVYGPQTDAALKQVCSDNIFDRPVWHDWLTATADLGFSKVTA